MGKTLSYAVGLTENAIRPSAVGKKNSLFFGDAEAGEISAILHTVIENARVLAVIPGASPAAGATYAVAVSHQDAVILKWIKDTNGSVDLVVRAAADINNKTQGAKTFTTQPVSHWAPGCERVTRQAATSSGVVRRPAGLRAWALATMASLPGILRNAGVSVTPALIATAVMPSGASSSESVFA